MTNPRNPLIISPDFPDRRLSLVCVLVSVLQKDASLSPEENVIWSIGRAAVIIALIAASLFGASAKAAGRRASARDLITRDLINRDIDDRLRITLRGNTRPEADPANDRGPVPDDFKLEHMLLQLRRPPELESNMTNTWNPSRSATPRISTSGSRLRKSATPTAFRIPICAASSPGCDRTESA